jgi:hypothetical protein
MRGEEDALRAKNEVLERELSDARAALAEAQTVREPSRGDRSPSRWLGRLSDGLTRGLRWLTPPPAPSFRWPRYLALAILVAMLTASGALLATLMATLGDATAASSASLTSEPSFWLVLGWLFLGPGSVTWLAARVLGAPSPNAAGFFAGIATFVVAMTPMAHPIFQDAPRMLLLGHVHGTLDEAAASPVIAWAHLEPAYIAGEVGEGVSVSESTDSDGRVTRSSSQSFCAPIVPSPGWRGAVSFVLCVEDRSALPAVPGVGVVEGRVGLAFTPNDRSIAALASQGVLMAPGARVVGATGPMQSTLGLGLLAFGLLLGLGSSLSALVAVRAAVARD